MFLRRLKKRNQRIRARRQRANRTSLLEQSQPLFFRKLEQRRVLNASFAFDAGLLTLSGFEDASEDALTISESGTSYVFTLSDTDSDWDNAGKNVTGLTAKDNVLSADWNVLDLNALTVSDSAKQDFALTLKAVDFGHAGKEVSDVTLGAADNGVVRDYDLGVVRVRDRLVGAQFE